MNKILLTILLTSISCFCFSQVTVSKQDGGLVVTKLGMGIMVNKGSSLNRQWIILNDQSCPAQLENTGINTSYTSSEYAMTASGRLIVKEPITAYKVVYVLYDVFGKHLRSLSTLWVTDVDKNIDLIQSGLWYATEHDIREYFISVAYIDDIRTKDGKLWHSNYKILKDELNKLQITFDETYFPKNEKENK